MFAPFSPSFPHPSTRPLFRLIKLSSPKLNYIIGIGAIILYLAGIVAVIPSTDPDAVAVFCNLTPWLAAIGYSLCYGTIVVKMARVYRIFTNPSTNKKVQFFFNRRDIVLCLGRTGVGGGGGW